MAGIASRHGGCSSRQGLSLLKGGSGRDTPGCSAAAALSAHPPLGPAAPALLPPPAVHACAAAGAHAPAALRPPRGMADHPGLAGGSACAAALPGCPLAGWPLVCAQQPLPPLPHLPPPPQAGCPAALSWQWWRCGRAPAAAHHGAVTLLLHHTSPPHCYCCCSRSSCSAALPPLHPEPPAAAAGCAAAARCAAHPAAWAPALQPALPAAVCGCRPGSRRRCHPERR